MHPGKFQGFSVGIYEIKRQPCKFKQYFAAVYKLFFASEPAEDFSIDFIDIHAAAFDYVILCA